MYNLPGFLASGPSAVVAGGVAGARAGCFRDVGGLWATGRYHRKVHQCLHDRSFEVILVNPLRASPRRWANRVDAKIGWAILSLWLRLPQELGGSPGAALVDAKQVADEVDGETVTRASAADLDDHIAGAAIKAVIAGDPEQRYAILTSIR